MSRVPLLEPVVLITSVPPGSLGRKKRHAMESAPVDSSRLGSRKKLCLGPGLQVGSPLPSTDFEVLLPPLGSWKNQLIGRSDKVRTAVLHLVYKETDTSQGL
jgi:hypothetical protein